jgi:hypothetical protein
MINMKLLIRTHFWREDWVTYEPNKVSTGEKRQSSSPAVVIGIIALKQQL